MNQTAVTAQAAAEWATAPAPMLHSDETREFVSVLFDGLTGFVNCRGIKEPAPSNGAAHTWDKWFPISPDLAEAVVGFADECNASGYGAFLVPAPMAEGGRTAADLLSLPWLPLDLDAGDIDAQEARLTAAIGQPTLRVLSGGTTRDTGQAKRHLYYRLAEPAAKDDVAYKAARIALAERFGGDTKVGRNPVQLLRIAGSCHRKGGEKAVRLHSASPAAVYPLTALAAALGTGAAPQALGDAFDFDFNNVMPLHSNVERVLTSPIRSEGQDDVTRFEGAGIAIGHYLRQVREGRMTQDEAWEASKAWNVANMRPAWDESRLRTDFDRLVRIDIEAHGPLVAPAPVAPVDAADGWSIEDWGLARFAREIPERKWLVEGLIPLATAGIFAAPGDAGKSMLALRLAYAVACTPAPEATAYSPAGISDTGRFFGQPVTARGSVVMLTAEDDEDEVARRLGGIGGNAMRRRAQPGNKFMVVPMPSAGGVRAIMTASPSQGPRPTPFWGKLREQLLTVPNLKLIILDPLSSFVSANLDADNMAGAALMAMLGELATATGATVMVLHHFNKGGSARIMSLGDARSAIRGASSLVDNARWALAMWEADEEQAVEALKAAGRHTMRRQEGVVYVGGITKSNAPAVKMPRTLVRNAATGILEDCTDLVRAARPGQAELDEAVFQALKDKANADPYFSFGLRRTAAWNACEPVFIARKLNVVKDQIEGILARLLAAGRLEQVGKRGGSPVFGPVLE